MKNKYQATVRVEPLEDRTVISATSPLQLPSHGVVHVGEVTRPAIFDQRNAAPLGDGSIGENQISARHQVSTALQQTPVTVQLREHSRQPSKVKSGIALSFVNGEILEHDLRKNGASDADVEYLMRLKKKKQDESIAYTVNSPEIALRFV